MQTRPVLRNVLKLGADRVYSRGGARPVTGLNWATLTSGVSTHLRSLWHHAGRWVIVGDSGVIRTSDDDGATWTARTSGTALSLRTVKYWKGNWWVVGYGDTGVHTILKSADGATWSSVTVPTKGAASLLTIGFSDDRMLLGGWEWNFADEKALIVSTTDGSTFTWTVFNTFFGAYGIDFASGKFVVGGSDAADDTTAYMATTTDGVSLTTITTPGFGWAMYTVQHNGKNWVAADGDGNVRHSDDAQTWTAGSAPAIANEECWRCTADPWGTLLICGGLNLSAKIIRSVDNGRNWEQVYLNTAEHLMTKAIHGPGYWLAVGYGGLLLKSVDI